MQTELASWARGTDLGREVDAMLRRCVHCGFCSATCPTYQVLGDERDSPRGRIYLIKQVMEGASPTQATQTHLDRCLTCRNCETTCPSGVEYGHLIDLGRKVVDARVRRTWPDRLRRRLLRKSMNSSWFGPVMRLAQAVRPMLPAALKRKVPVRRPAGPVPEGVRHARQVLMPLGCVQASMMPAIDAATIRVLDAVGVGAMLLTGSGCCGAVNFHLDAQDAALAQMRSNIDAWWPLLNEGGVEAIVMNASGCGGTVKDYAHHLRHDPDYADKAVFVVSRVKDVAELLAPHAKGLAERLGPAPRAVFHPPCTLQHWQGLRALNEQLLADLGFTLQPFADSHLCCGSAGTYSVLNPLLSQTLRDRKLAALSDAQTDVIMSANMGCIAHLQGGTRIPVHHWIEVLDERLSSPRQA
ncbi:glycolate oxidase subunit GlcF [Bordetella avium]|uniref:Glycolate oxidase iron-sulfur subunit n=1 Tax=Bordetella avium (strain 197N) TaxID=360910 RepID=Q2KZ65_BORA1|nr:glycolate oxidase subunit GlcF [Bordetella avium]AZY52855.1 glycolate oxidase iron-sulfur subunit [Bordetella avium]RIQ12153.1 glycolate oxidase iron-sulfur subunit [Bordetella avium]RIQ19027.1 glycolate oxidase iron-sulfur subunit [Bordetella avium]RIQ31936.1 glycolate oxidase iron-sulfur subunit [Bordetella avium]RIQ38110.1 glycolate oxidase iron-sulfur subunit [Bordetella avium]